MTKQEAIAKAAAGIRQHKKTPDAIKLTALLDELAQAVEMKKSVLVQEAEKLITEQDAKKSSGYGELGFTVGEAPKRVVSVIEGEPFEDQAVFVADSNGKLPERTPGKNYLVVEVPDDVRVTVQPPANIADGARRKVMSVEVIYRPDGSAKAEKVSPKKRGKGNGPVVDTTIAK